MTDEIYQPVPEQWLVTPEDASAAREGPAFAPGATVALVSNGKLTETMGDALERKLRALGAGNVLRFAQYYLDGQPSAELIDDVARLADAALVGLGN